MLKFVESNKRYLLLILIALTCTILICVAFLGFSSHTESPLNSTALKENSNNEFELQLPSSVQMKSITDLEELMNNLNDNKTREYTRQILKSIFEVSKLNTFEQLIRAGIFWLVDFLTLTVEALIRWISEVWQYLVEVFGLIKANFVKMVVNSLICASKRLIVVIRGDEKNPNSEEVMRNYTNEFRRLAQVLTTIIHDESIGGTVRLVDQYKIHENASAKLDELFESTTASLVDNQRSYFAGKYSESYGAGDIDKMLYYSIILDMIRAISYSIRLINRYRGILEFAESMAANTERMQFTGNIIVTEMRDKEWNVDNFKISEIENAVEIELIENIIERTNESMVKVTLSDVILLRSRQVVNLISDISKILEFRGYVSISKNVEDLVVRLNGSESRILWIWKQLKGGRRDNFIKDWYVTLNTIEIIVSIIEKMPDASDIFSSEPLTLIAQSLDGLEKYWIGQTPNQYEDAAIEKLLKAVDVNYLFKISQSSLVSFAESVGRGIISMAKNSDYTLDLIYNTMEAASGIALRTFEELSASFKASLIHLL